MRRTNRIGLGLFAAVPWLFLALGAKSTISNEGLRLVLTANRRSNLAPCGCSPRQTGGIAHEAVVLRDLRAEAAGRRLKCEVIDLGPTGSNDADLGAFRDYFREAGFDSVDIAPQDDPGGVAAKVFADSGIPSLVRSSDAPGIAYKFLLGKKILMARLDFANPDVGVQTFARIAKSRRIVSAVLVADRIFAVSLSNLIGRDGPSIVLIAKDAPHEDVTEFGCRIVRMPESGEALAIDFSSDAKALIHRTPILSTASTDPKVQTIVDRYYKAVEVVASPGLEVAEGAFETAERCGSCHNAEYAQWRTTPHAHAVATLRGKNRLVGECMSCHSALQRTMKIFDPNHPLAHEGVTCIDCHGDGVRHTVTQKAVDIVRDPAVSICLACHNPKNDTGFRFDLRRSAIVHGPSHP